MQVLIEKRIMNEIPVIVAKRDDNLRKPLVLISHGFTRSKEDFVDKGYLQELAMKGYYAVAIDNRLHGDRLGPDFKSVVINQFGKVDLIALRKAMKETAEDVTLLIDELSLLEEVDKDNIAMIGVSMGGFVTHRAVVIDSRIKVGIPIISSPYWDDIPGDVTTQMNEENRDKLIKISEDYQPANHKGNYAPTALLMLVGDMDMHYNLHKIQSFYVTLKGYYSTCPENLNLIIYPDTMHEFKQEMWEQALQWLRKWLLVYD
jgi:pimeloyl-ACP methyl ester carboxylesterase